MGLIFHYGNVDKTTVKSPFTVSTGTSIKQLTPKNRKFLESIQLTVIRNYPKNEWQYIRRDK